MSSTWIITNLYLSYERYCVKFEFDCRLLIPSIFVHFTSLSISSSNFTITSPFATF